MSVPCSLFASVLRPAAASSERPRALRLRVRAGSDALFPLFREPPPGLFEDTRAVLTRLNAALKALNQTLSAAEPFSRWIDLCPWVGLALMLMAFAVGLFACPGALSTETARGGSCSNVDQEPWVIYVTAVLVMGMIVAAVSLVVLLVRREALYLQRAQARCTELNACDAGLRLSAAEERRRGRLELQMNLLLEQGLPVNAAPVAALDLSALSDGEEESAPLLPRCS